jgi:hypothetical protein
MSSDTNSQRSTQLSGDGLNLEADNLNGGVISNETTETDDLGSGVRRSSTFRVACEKAAEVINEKYAVSPLSGTPSQVTSWPIGAGVTAPPRGRSVSFSPKIKVHTPEGSSETFHEELIRLRKEKKIYHNEICYEARKLLTEHLASGETEHELQVAYSTMPQLSCSLRVGTECEQTNMAFSCSEKQADVSDVAKGSSYFLKVVLPVTPDSDVGGEAVKLRIRHGNGSPITTPEKSASQDCDVTGETHRHLDH